MELLSGLILIAATALACIIANSGLAGWYADFLRWGAGGWTVHSFIDDALMSVFFFTVGMEIKFEMLRGALVSKEKALLPMIGALGGMLVPALIFFCLNDEAAFSRGWGIPTATDIAFAVGALALLGRRVSRELRVWLLTLAIADDLGAVLVIAFFYAKSVQVVPLVLSVLIFVLIGFLVRRGFRTILLFLPLACAAWWGIHLSGVHATIAGCVLGLLVPIGQEGGASPLRHWLHRLQPISSLVIMPIFALANAGVVFSEITLERFNAPFVAAISYALFIGKPLGIFSFSWVSLKLGLTKLPERVNLINLFGAACLAGIGFTMALFISNLALSTEADLQLAKIAIVKGSALSLVFGIVILFVANRRNKSQTN